MGIYDFIMLAILVCAVLFGLWKGLAWQVASVAAIVISYFVAVNFSGVVSPYITDEPWGRFAAMFILYIGTSLGIWIIFGFVRRTIDDLRLDGFDHQAGALVGAVQGALICIVVTLFAVTLLGENTRKTICQSHSGYYIAKALDKFSAFVPKQYHEMVGPYFNNFAKAMNEHAPKEGKEILGQLVVIDPSEVNESNQYTGSWSFPEGDSNFDLGEAAKGLIEAAKTRINENRK